MAQEIDLIFETLREIKRVNSVNSESFERLLAEIERKLELLGKNSVTTELIKSYLSDMAKMTDEKYQTALTKFTDIEKALKAIFNGQDGHARTNDLKELFASFSNNMNNVYTEIRQQKSAVASIERKISEITTNKTDKEDILRTISLLKNDFENINGSYKYTIDTVSTDLKNIISGIARISQSTDTANISGRIESIQKAVSDISGFLGSLDKRTNVLETSLEAVATAENLKYVQGIIDTLLDKTSDIQQRIINTATKPEVTDIKETGDTIKKILQDMNAKKEFSEIVTASDQLIEKTDDLKNDLAGISKDLKNIPDTKALEDAVTALSEKLDIIEEGLEKADASELLTITGSNLKKLTTELNTGKKIISDIYNVVENKVLTAIDGISFEGESFEIKNNISAMLKELPQKEDIERILDEQKASKETLDTLLNRSDKILDRFDNLPTHDDMASLNSNQLGLVENLQDVAAKDDISNISSKIDNVENEIKNKNYDKEFESVYDKTSAIEKWLKGSKVKENVQEIAGEIAKKPDREEVFKILETLDAIINAIEELSQNTDAGKVKNTISDIYRQIEDLKNEFISTTEMHNDSVIVILSELQRNVSNIVTGDEFNSFVEELKAILGKISEYRAETETDQNAVSEYTNAVLNKLEAINTDIIREFLDVKEGLSDVKNKVASIQDWLTNSKIKENTDELLAQMQTKPDREDVMKVLKVVEAIVGDLSEISQKESAQDVDSKVSDVFKKLEDLRTEFIETSEKQNGSVVEHLSEIQESVENIIKGEDFEGFSNEVKRLLEVIVSNTDKINSDYIAIKEYQVAILDKLDSLDAQAIKEAFESRSTAVEDTLTNIAEYLNNVNKIDTTDIKNTVNKIREFLETRQSAFDEYENSSQETIDIMENYLTEIKRILDLSDFAVAENVKNKLLQIESDLELYHSQNENALTDIIAKLDEYQEFAKTLDEPYSNQDLKASMDEISEIKGMISALGDSFAAMQYEDNSKEKGVADFITDRLDNLVQGLDELSAATDSRLQQGFAYNAALIEEKTATLLEFIQGLRHENSQNPNLYEPLTVADSKLTDYKQELELINTDVINIINSNADKLLDEVAPLRQMLESLCSGTEIQKTLGTDLAGLQEALSEDLKDKGTGAHTILGRIEYTYKQISNDLTNLEDNVKTVVMTDIDSVMRQMNELQQSVEETIGKIIPPEASSMAEFREFADNIEKFKNSQKQYIEKAAGEIKDKMDVQHEELKSLLTVSLNNEKIIKAIDDLKSNILNKAFTIRRIQETQNAAGSDDIESAVTADDIQNRSEYNSQETLMILDEVRSDYSRFAAEIKALSGESTEIKKILTAMQDKLKALTVLPVPAVNENTNQEENPDRNPEKENTKKEEVIVGKDNFDFIQALDCLKSDVSNISKNVDRVLTQEEKEAAITGSGTGTEAFQILSQKLDKIQKRITSGEWLEEIKSYIANGKLGTTLDLILGKLDILALTDSCEWVKDVKLLVEQVKEGALSAKIDPQITSMIKLLNDKVDILAESDDYELFEELQDIIQYSNPALNSETPELLDLINKKLDLLANTDADLNLDDLSDRLAAIEDKLDNITYTTNEPETPAFVDDMMYTLMNLEEKIDKFSGGTDEQSGENSQNPNSSSKELKLLHKRIDSFSKKLDEFASAAGISLAGEVQDRLGLIENKIDVIAMSNNDEDFEEVKQTLGSLEEKLSDSTASGVGKAVETLNKKLDLLDAKVDIVASTDTFNDIEDIKASLESVEDDIHAVKKFAGVDSEITEILEVINHKIDMISQKGNENTQKEFREVKDLIMAQMDYIDSLESNNKTDAVKKCLKELTVEINNLNTEQNTRQIQKTIRDMKESVMAAVVTVFEQVSFTEESEDIKDFVEEKTDEINQNLAAMTSRLKQITDTAGASEDYTYSMQDIESDLAKLRLALNDLQVHEQENQTSRLSSILENINQIGSCVNDLQKSLPQGELLGMQLKFDQINSDIESLTKLSNHLLATSDETYNTLNSHFETFGRTITEQLTARVDKVAKLLETSNASDAVMRQALIYVGEWIDSASDSMNKITANSDEIIEVKTAIEGLKKVLPEQTNILESLEEKFDEQQERLAFFEKQITKLSCIEDKFEEQQERIDRLEMTIEKILSAVEDIDDTKVTRKIDKIDKQLSKLSINIEKLASYVD